MPFAVVRSVEQPIEEPLISHTMSLQVVTPIVGERRTIIVLCYIIFFLYVNRAIIPGAPESFQIFISKSLGVKVSQQNFYLGLLQSIYVASTALFSLPFGYMAFTRKPFQLITWGLLSWVVGAVVCGLAYAAESYYVLALGRVLMGAGEAAFQSNAIPFINRHAPKKNSTAWLGLCFASFTVGNALGYMYGSVFAGSPLTWAAAFYVEALLMAPAIVYTAFLIPASLTDKPGLLLSESANIQNYVPPQPTLRQWLGVFTDLPFTMVALGFGAYAFMIGCFSTFTPTLLIGLGYYETEDDASLIFGIIVVVCGTVGSLAGGFVVDRLTEGNTVPQNRRCKIAIDTLVVIIVISAASAIAMSQLTSSKTGLLVMLALAFLFLAAAIPPQNVAVMERFPEPRQPMAMAANTAIMVLFGDMPAPMVLGWIKDTWAPECGSVLIAGRPRLNPNCYLDQGGLVNVLLFSTLWLIWAVIFWVAAKLLVHVRSEKEIVSIETPVRGTD